MVSAAPAKAKSGKNPHVDALFESIERELKEPRAVRPPLIRDVLQTRRDELAALLADGAKAVKESDRPMAEALGESLAKGFKDLDDSRTARPGAVSGAQFYSAEARQTAVDTAVVVNSIRQDVGDRVGNSALVQQIRTGCGIGVDLSASSPIDVRDMAFAQQQELSKPATKQVLEDRGLSVSLLLEELEPLLAKLTAEIGKGAGTTLTKGEVTSLENKALWWIDVTLGRAVVFFKQRKVTQVAGKLVQRVPKKHSRRVTDAGVKDGEEEKPSPGEGDKKDPSAGE